MIVLDSKVRDIDRLTFSPTGRDLAISGTRARIQVWRGLPAARPTAVFSDLKMYYLRRWAFSPDASRLYLAHGWNGQTLVLDIDTLGQLPHPDVPRGPTWFHFTEQGGFLLVAHGKNQFSRLDQAAGQPGVFLPAWTVENPRHWSGMWNFVGDICPGGARFLGIELRSRHRKGRWGVDWQAVVRSTTTGAIERNARWDSGGYLGLIACSPRGDCFARTSGMRLFVHDLAHPNHEPLRILNDNRKHFTGIAFHPSGDYLAATSNDTTVKLYETRTWQVARLFSWEVGRLGAVAFSPDGCQGAVGSHSGKVVVWDIDL